MELGFLGCSGELSSAQMSSELKPGCSKSVLGAVGEGFGPPGAGGALVLWSLAAFMYLGVMVSTFFCAFPPFRPAKTL